jgi:hypothetical protein
MKTTSPRSSIVGFLALASVLLLTSACGKGTHITITPNFALKEFAEVNQFAEADLPKPKGYQSSGTIKSRNRTYATIKVFLSDGVDKKPLVIDLKRHDRAYLAETAVYQEEKFGAFLSVGMDKESKYTAGLRMRWDF